jgi:hypothetical protein
MEKRQIKEYEEELKQEMYARMREEANIYNEETRYEE